MGTLRVGKFGVGLGDGKFGVEAWGMGSRLGEDTEGRDGRRGGSFGCAALRFLRLRSGRAGQAAGGSRERGKGREGDYSFDSF